MNDKITIVTRKSRLALQQTEIVKQELLQKHPNLQIEITGISTSGDEILDQPLNKIGGKGLFITELEQYLLQGKADIAVHSMKDMPANLADGLGIGAILTRADARDVFVSKQFATFKDLPAGSVVGTSSLRRQAQILLLRHDLQVKPLRGNVETRLDKMLSGEYAAIILAAAGLERLGLNEWIQQPFDPVHLLPAVGQGAIGIEYKLDNTALKQMLEPLNHVDTALCVHAERAMNAMLDGGCQAPIAGYATITNDTLTLHGKVVDPNGLFIYTDVLSGPKHDAVKIGKAVAEQLIGEGAQELIDKLRHQWQR